MPGDLVPTAYRMPSAWTHRQKERLLLCAELGVALWLHLQVVNELASRSIQIEKDPRNMLRCVAKRASRQTEPKNQRHWVLCMESLMESYLNCCNHLYIIPNFWLISGSLRFSTCPSGPNQMLFTYPVGIRLLPTPSKSKLTTTQLHSWLLIKQII